MANSSAEPLIKSSWKNCSKISHDKFGTVVSIYTYLGSLFIYLGSFLFGKLLVLLQILTCGDLEMDLPKIHRKLTLDPPQIPAGLSIPST
jgi:hypothetical protein